MRRSLVVLSVLALCLSGASTAFATGSPPPNDAISGAATLKPVDPDVQDSDTGAVFNDTFATLESGEAQPVGPGCSMVRRTGWYRWTAPASGAMRLVLSSDLDAALAVYSGGGRPGAQQGCDDGSSTTDPLVDLRVSQGVTYWVQVGTTTDRVGALTLMAFFSTTPVNDGITNALTLHPDNAGFDNGAAANLSSATVELGEPQPVSGGCGPENRTRWWRWTADRTGSFDALALGDASVQMAVYSGAGKPQQELGCETAARNEAARTPLTVGRTYWFQLGTTSSNAWVDAVVYFSIHVVPVNDAISTATAVTFSDVSNVLGAFSDYDTTLASTEPSEPQPTACGGGVGSTVWYSFTAQTSVILDLTDFVSVTGVPRKGDDVEAIYSGASGPTAFVACSSDNGSRSATGDPQAELRTTLAAGTKYWVQIGGTQGQSDSGLLAMQGTNPAPQLAQTSARGVVTLSITTAPAFKGGTVYFFRRSGLTGQVVPLGTGVVDANGIAKRTFNARTAQILAIYGKVTNATDITTPYSNTITFKVK